MSEFAERLAAIVAEYAVEAVEIVDPYDPEFQAALTARYERATGAHPTEFGHLGAVALKAILGEPLPPMVVLTVSQLATIWGMGVLAGAEASHRG